MWLYEVRKTWLDKEDVVIQGEEDVVIQGEEDMDIQGRRGYTR